MDDYPAEPALLAIPLHKLPVLGTPWIIQPFLGCGGKYKFSSHMTWTRSRPLSKIDAERQSGIRGRAFRMRHSALVHSEYKLCELLSVLRVFLDPWLSNDTFIHMLNNCRFVGAQSIGEDMALLRGRAEVANSQRSAPVAIAVDEVTMRPCFGCQREASRSYESVLRCRTSDDARQASPVAGTTYRGRKEKG